MYFVHTENKYNIPDRLWGPPASYPVGTRASFPRSKAVGSEADHSPPSSAKIKNVWNYTSFPNTPSCAQLKKHRDNFNNNNNAIIIASVIYAGHLVLLEEWNLGSCDGTGMWLGWGIKGMHTAFWWEDILENVLVEDWEGDGNIVSRGIL
jgi:hypothetical protein